MCLMCLENPDYTHTCGLILCVITFAQMGKPRVREVPAFPRCWQRWGWHCSILGILPTTPSSYRNPRQALSRLPASLLSEPHHPQTPSSFPGAHPSFRTQPGAPDLTLSPWSGPEWPCPFYDPPHIMVTCLSLPLVSKLFGVFFPP